MDLVLLGSCFLKLDNKESLHDKVWFSVLELLFPLMFRSSHPLARFIKFAMCSGPRHLDPDMIRHLTGRAWLC